MRDEKTAAELQEIANRLIEISVRFYGKAVGNKLSKLAYEVENVRRKVEGDK